MSIIPSDNRPWGNSFMNPNNIRTPLEELARTAADRLLGKAPPIRDTVSNNNWRFSSSLVDYDSEGNILTDKFGYPRFKRQPTELDFPNTADGKAWFKRNLEYYNTVVKPTGGGGPAIPKWASTEALATNWLKIYGTGLSKEDQALIKKMWKDGNAAGLTADAIKEGIASSKPMLKLYPANAARIKAGLKPYSIENYKAYKDSYKQVFDKFGDLVPNKKEQERLMTTWLSANVSPEEAVGRLNLGREVAKSVPQEVKDALRTYYGIDEKGIAAFVMNPKMSQEELLDKYSTIKIGGQAGIQGVNISRDLAESLTEQDIDEAAAKAALVQTAGEQQTFGVISGAREGENITGDELVAGTLNTDAEATRKRTGLLREEAARFSGSGGGQRVLGSGDVSGSF